MGLCLFVCVNVVACLLVCVSILQGRKIISLVSRESQSDCDLCVLTESKTAA